jgi:hypothetical protein
MLEILQEKHPNSTNTKFSEIEEFTNGDKFDQPMILLNHVEPNE